MADLLIWMVAALSAVGGVVLGRVWGQVEGKRTGKREAERDAMEDKNTCSPAAGYAGSVDKTATAASQVAAFFGAASPSDFAISGDTVSWIGPSGDWGLRRMMLH